MYYYVVVTRNGRDYYLTSPKYKTWALEETQTHNLYLFTTRAEALAQWAATGLAEDGDTVQVMYKY